MKRFIAPCVLILGLSFILYKRKTLWRLKEYKKQMSGWDWRSAEDFTDLEVAVQKGLIDPSDAEHIFNTKWPSGPKNDPGISNAQAQLMVDYAVHHKHKQDLLRGMQSY